MGDNLRSSDIREIVYREYDSDEESDISIVGNEEVPDNVLLDMSESDSENEVGLSLSTCVSPEPFVNRVVDIGLGPSTSSLSQVGPGPSRPTVAYVGSVTSDFSPKSSPLPPSPEPPSEHGNEDSELFAPPSPVPPSPPPPGDDESDSTDSSVSGSSLPIATRAKLPKWVRVIPPEPEKNIENEFKVRNSGIRNCPPRNSHPIAYFYLFFSELLMNMFVRETNSYANRVINRKRLSGELANKSRLKKWVDVTLSEMKKFFALVINMGIDKRNNVVDYWSTKKSLYLPFFSETMSVNRFQLISSMFRITATRPLIQRGYRGYDPWNKVRPLLDHVNKAMKNHFIPYQNISIDESLIGMKNRCVFIQYMPKKKHCRFGIKKFELCDSKTSYVYNVSLYSGRDFLADGNDPFTHKVIMNELSLCKLLGKGYHVFTDNWYTKLPLAKELLSKKTYLTGTVNKNTRDLSKQAKLIVLGREESAYFRHQKNILLVKYNQRAKNKPVYLISTGVNAEDRLITSKHGLQAVKPVMINSYNLNMGGVDNSDKSVYHLSVSRMTKKYWKKIFTNLLDICLFDAYLLYKENTDKPMTRQDFHSSIVETLADEGEPIVPAILQNTEHKLDHLPGRKERVCYVCANNPMGPKKGRTSFWCPGCNCGIHPLCYNKLEHYWRPVQRGKKRRAPGSDSE